MKKIIIFLLVLIMVFTLAVPVGAVTPALKVPDMPEISDIKIETKVKIEVTESFWDHWFTEHPINIKIPIRFNLDR